MTIKITTSYLFVKLYGSAPVIGRYALCLIIVLPRVRAQNSPLMYSVGVMMDGVQPTALTDSKMRLSVYSSNSTLRGRQHDNIAVSISSTEPLTKRRLSVDSVEFLTTVWTIRMPGGDTDLEGNLNDEELSQSRRQVRSRNTGYR